MANLLGDEKPTICRVISFLKGSRRHEGEKTVKCQNDGIFDGQKMRRARAFTGVRHSSVSTFTVVYYNELQ
jgi:hypothetical protein